MPNKKKAYGLDAERIYTVLCSASGEKFVGIWPQSAVGLSVASFRRLLALVDLDKSHPAPAHPNTTVLRTVVACKTVVINNIKHWVFKIRRSAFHRTIPLTAFGWKLFAFDCSAKL